jgi:DNA-binding response OmpR family regulator
VIADDDACIRALIGDWVEAAGLLPVEVETGAAAVEAVRYLAPVLVIVDLHLGDSDGRDAISAIRRLDKGVHVILATAEDDARALFRAVEAGADELLRKPFDRGALRQALAAAVTRGAASPRRWT